MSVAFGEKIMIRVLRGQGEKIDQSSSFDIKVVPQAISEKIKT